MDMPQAGAMAVFKLDGKSFKNSVDQLNKKFKSSKFSWKVRSG